MKDIAENNDALKALIREEGLLTPSPDFTDRVMQMVKESESKTASVYKPLLSRRARMIITSFVLVLVMFSWWFITNQDPQGTTSSIIDPLTSYVNNLDFSIPYNTGALLLTSIVIASIAFLLSLDLWLSQKFRNVSS